MIKKKKAAGHGGKPLIPAPRRQRPVALYDFEANVGHIASKTRHTKISSNSVSLREGGICMD